MRSLFIAAGAVVVAGFAGGLAWTFVPAPERPTEAREAPAFTGDWQVSQFRSPNDGSPAIAMTLATNTVVPGQSQVAPGMALLSLQCAEGNTSAILQFGKDVLRDLEGSGDVVYRINGRGEAHLTFQQSTDGKAMGLWTNELSVPFIESLIGANSLNIEAIPYKELPVKARFNVSGLDKAIAPLREACGW